MSLNSIINNSGALVALESLNATNAQLKTTQNRISTGLKVAGAQDDGAVWAIAQNERSNISALSSEQDSLNRNISTADVAVSAGQTISDLLNQMKGKALAATDPTQNATSVAALNSDYQSIIKQISAIVATADFNGANLINSGGFALTEAAFDSQTVETAPLTSTGGFTILSTGSTFTATYFGQVWVSSDNLSVGGPNIIFTANSSFTSGATASTVLALINASITNVNAAVAKFGAGANALQTQLSFVQSQQDTMTTGLGNLVDANVATESANLTALQIKQHLGLQVLSIANASWSSVLRLFRQAGGAQSIIQPA